MSLAKFAPSLRIRAVRFRKRLNDLIARHRFPLDLAPIESALDELLGSAPGILMTHSSLSACGHVPGGAEMIIEAIHSRTQTLVMPTHTYCYPPAGGGEPPLFDSRESRSRVGKITDLFWRKPEVLRSIHPTHSLAAAGPLAAEIVRGHQFCHTPCGRGTPYERLIDFDAAVLMFGTTMNTYTLFHTAEDLADCPYLYEPQLYELRALDENGKPVTVVMRRQNMRIPRRFQEMDHVLEAEGLLRRQRLGRGELLYLPSSRDIHRFVIRQLQKDPYYLVDESARPRKSQSPSPI